jgi:hypothetical protein
MLSKTLKNIVFERKGVKIAVTGFTYSTKNQFIIAHELLMQELI